MRRYLAVFLALAGTMAGAQQPVETVTDLYKAGEVLQQEGRHEEALSKFGAVIQRDPGDWHARSKIVQACQALGWIKDRDLHRAALFALRKTGKSESLARQDQYCRDQFMVGTNKVMTLEYFEPKGDRPVKYAFMVLDAAGKEPRYRVTFAVQEAPAVAPASTRAPAPGTPKKVEWTYHLDGYWPGGVHRAYGSLQQEPDYEAVRAMVVEIIEGRREALPDSTSVEPPPGTESRRPGTIGPRTPRRRD